MIKRTLVQCIPHPNLPQLIDFIGFVGVSNRLSTAPALVRAVTKLHPIKACQQAQIAVRDLLAVNKEKKVV